MRLFACKRNCALKTSWPKVICVYLFITKQGACCVLDSDNAIFQANL